VLTHETNQKTTQHVTSYWRQNVSMDVLYNVILTLNQP